MKKNRLNKLIVILSTREIRSTDAGRGRYPRVPGAPQYTKRGLFHLTFSDENFARCARIIPNCVGFALVRLRSRLRNMRGRDRVKSQLREARRCRRGLWTTRKRGCGLWTTRFCGCMKTRVREARRRGRGLYVHDEARENS